MSNDTDFPELTNDQFAALKRPALPKRVRLALGLSQQTFSDRYGIPLRTLQEWEQRRSEPDAAVISYRYAIEQAPDAVAEALARSRAAQTVNRLQKASHRRRPISSHTSGCMSPLSRESTGGTRARSACEGHVSQHGQLLGDPDRFLNRQLSLPILALPANAEGHSAKLRARPERLLPIESAEHETDHSEADEGERGGEVLLIVADEAAAAGEP